MDRNKLWKILKEMGLPNHLTSLLRNLYSDQEATVRTRHGKMHLFQIRKGVCQGYILSPSLFNFYAEWSEVKWSHSVVSNSLRPMDCSLSGSSVHGIFQARVLEWIATSFSRGSSQPRNQTWVSCIAGKCFKSEKSKWCEILGWINQTGIKIVGRYINHLRSAGDKTVMAEWKEELKNLLMKVKEESEKVGLKFNI